MSIVTVVFNAREHFQTSFESVRRQHYRNIEYIVIDGGSTDGTVDFIRENEDTIDYWKSEPDTGIYNAMNKGIGLAMGKIIGLVNADDVIYPSAVADVVDVLTRHPDAGFTCAPVDLASDDGSIYGQVRPLADDELETRMYREMPFPHQGMYVRREVYEELGGFDESYKLSADYDFLLRLLENSVPYVRIESPVGYFRDGGASGGLQTFIETRRIQKKHGLSKWRLEYQFYSSLAKIACCRILPWRVLRSLKKVRKSSKHKWY
ncbi:glycosyltransferase family 2 protein [Aquisalimonas lutea]|uniref:glycosyltransferase family 2 protein n=1 Tax=Aquisalimonas lutea TaxID=1327750 RepID=UPI0025B4B417|nr:glycosyltransferase family 2 protein [Aquisalimonas lutea]MDN3517826.1 glycosyltransferase family 2 protein [Aquisalimonas lutea]